MIFSFIFFYFSLIVLFREYIFWIQICLLVFQEAGGAVLGSAPVHKHNTYSCTSLFISELAEKIVLFSVLGGVCSDFISWTLPPVFQCGLNFLTDIPSFKPSQPHWLEPHLYSSMKYWMDCTRMCLSYHYYQNSMYHAYVQDKTIISSQQCGFKHWRLWESMTFVKKTCEKRVRKKKRKHYKMW